LFTFGRERRASAWCRSQAALVFFFALYMEDRKAAAKPITRAEKIAEKKDCC